MESIMNCAEKTKEIISILDGRFDLFTINPEIMDEWDEDHAVFMITLTEENYRDYAQLEYDLIAEIKEIIGKEIPVVYGMYNDPESNYVLNVHSKFGGLAYEIELRKSVKS